MLNAPPHIGFALELIYADVVARHERLAGREVSFLTGTDEHGQKIAQKAAEAGKSPAAFTDEMSGLFRQLASRLNISNTDFIRTTEPRHADAVRAFWQLVEANGHIYKKRYGGLYCVGCEQFKTEKELVDGKCPIHLTVPEYIEEENYFFRLTSFRDALLKWYDEHPDFVVPDTKFNEAKQLVEGGLEDISISRSKEHLTWGIPVPGDDSQVVYVWFDALVNYLTAAGFPDPSYAKRWPADLHIIGKEINRFHTVLWPAMLMAAGIKPPQRVGVHGWIFVDGQKMSKSLGNVVDPDELREAFGTDGMRYLLLREIPFTGDGDYVRTRFIEKYDSDLANDLGNLAYRVTSMLQKYRDGVVPSAAPGERPAAWEDIGQGIGTLRFDLALDAIWKTIRDANQYVDRTKPWVLAKEEKKAELDAALYHLLETLRQVAWMIRPFMPQTSDKMLDELGQAAERDDLTIDSVSAWGGLQSGTKVTVGEPLFPRIEV